jgi:hypothetical protein
VGILNGSSMIRTSSRVTGSFGNGCTLINATMLEKNRRATSSDKLNVPYKIREAEYAIKSIGALNN